ncbi:MAG: AmmeMemoRadiSam system protein B [Sedimentisphaerales bacterium]|nr:AmmeMemoRadiSam system protein B [Sedimentisphaerales bacterium]
MQTRKPVVAGQFYPGQHDNCIDEINDCLDAATFEEKLPETIVAGIVPHAGWIFSGTLAAMVFSAIRQQHEKVHTFIVFGAAHGYHGFVPAVCDRGFWATPLGEAAVDEELAEEVLRTGDAAGDCRAHANEHSIEVQIPFIQYLFAGAKILPIIVPPTEKAITLGESVGSIIQRNEQKKIICIGSTDLTHYGPRYGFTPMGVGKDALQWADSVNDKKFIDDAVKLEPEALLAGAAENCNACGAGASAATIAAAKKLGTKKGVLLAHTNSDAIMRQKMGTSSSDSVGYAAIVF